MSGALDVRRVRVKRACNACRVKKRRCSGDTPECYRCAKRSIPCVYEEDIDEGPPGAVNGLVSNTLPPPPSDIKDYRDFYANIKDPKYSSLLKDLADEFFAADFHFLAGNFIDQNIFSTRLDKNDLPDHLLRAVVLCTLTGRQPQKDNTKNEEMLIWWYEKLQMDILTLIGEITIDFYQSILLLLINFYGYSGKKRSFFIFPILVRMAYSLLLNHPIKTIQSPLENELRNRMMWNCYVLDKELAGGIKEFSLVSESSINAPYPHDVLDSGNFTPTSSSVSDDYFDILAYTVKVHSMRYKVLAYTKAAAKNLDHWWKDGSQFWEYQRQLRVLTTSSLTPELQFNYSNINSRRSFRATQYFIKTHLQAYQVFCDLYRLALPGLKESSPQSLLNTVPPEILSHIRRECIFTSLMIIQYVKDNAYYLQNNREINIWMLSLLSENTRVLISAAYHQLYCLVDMSQADLGEVINTLFSLMYIYSKEANHRSVHKETIGYMARGCLQCGLAMYVPNECMEFRNYVPSGTTGGPKSYEDNNIDGINKPALILSAHHPLASSVSELTRQTTTNEADSTDNDGNNNHENFTSEDDPLYFLPQFSFFNFDDISYLLYDSPPMMTPQQQ